MYGLQILIIAALGFRDLWFNQMVYVFGFCLYVYLFFRRSNFSSVWFAVFFISYNY